MCDSVFVAISKRAQRQTATTMAREALQEND